MMFELYLYLLLSLLVTLAYYTIIIENPINALSSLIGCFILTACLFIMFDFNFFAMIIITIYIGAIAMFFLFVLIFINIPIKLQETTKIDFIFYNVIFFLFLLFLYQYPFFDFQAILQIPDVLFLLDYTDTLLVLGILLYYYAFIFVYYTAILLYIAMIGAIFFITVDLD